MKKSVLIFLIVLITYGCKSTNKVPAGEVAITIPCSDEKLMSDADFYRSRGDGVGASVSNAESIAMANALQNFTIEFESVVSSVLDNYFKATQSDFDVKNQNRFEQLGRIVSSNTVKGAKRICSQATRIIEDGPQKGLYRYYVAYEFAHENFIDSFKSKLSEEDEIKIDYDYEKFREIYKSEISKKINK